MLAGRYEDLKLGPVKASSYFQPIYSSEAGFVVENGTRVDKAELLLPYTYFYGDTNVSYKVTLHLLHPKDSIQSRFYLSRESLPYDLNPVGEATFKPTFAKRDTLRMTLSDAVAQQLFSFANKSESEFKTGFAGFALVSDSSNNKAVLGYPATTDLYGRIRLSYQTSTPQTYDFLLAGNRRFNHITGKPNGVLENLNAPYSSVSSTATNGETYVQGGTGLMTRIEFPELTSTGQLSNVAVNRAELVVSPLPGSIISSSSLLILYSATGDGKLPRSANGLAPEYIPSSITALSPAPALAAYTNNRFTFDVTRYVADVLLKRRSNNGLYLSLPSVFNQIQGVSSATSLEESVNTISLGGHNHPTAPIKLKIYYTPIRAN
jgi:hypothetical protein